MSSTTYSTCAAEAFAASLFAACVHCNISVCSSTITPPTVCRQNNKKPKAGLFALLICSSCVLSALLHAVAGRQNLPRVTFKMRIRESECFYIKHVSLSACWIWHYLFVLSLNLHSTWHWFMLTPHLCIWDVKGQTSLWFVFFLTFLHQQENIHPHQPYSAPMLHKNDPVMDSDHSF